MDGRPWPRLLENWTWEEGGRELLLHLRSDVILHDETRLTASTAAESLRAVLDRPSSRALYPSLAEVTEISVIEPDQLLLRLGRPNSLVVEELDIPFGKGGQDIGTGPYRIAQNRPGEVVMERFDKYYRGRPLIEKVIIRSYEATRTAWASLLRGEIDLVTNVPPDTVDFLRTDDVQVLTSPRPYQYLVAFNSSRSQFRNPAVRRALNLAVDRARLVQVALRGHAEVATGPIWPRHWAYDPAIPTYSYDPPAATALLNATGLTMSRGVDSTDTPARLSFRCMIPIGWTTLERLALEVQRYLYDVGVDMQFEPLPLPEFNARIQAGDFDAVLIDMVSGTSVTRPYLFWRSSKGSDQLQSRFNVFGYESAQTERAFDALRESLDETTYRSAVSRLQRAFNEDPPALFLAWTQRTRAANRRFSIGLEEDQDPLYNIWRWTAAPQLASTTTP